MMNVFEKIISQVEAELESSEKFMREYDDSVAQKAYYSGMAHILYIIQKEVKDYNNGWISCSERLSDFYDNVLVCTESGGRTIAHLKHPNIEWIDMHLYKIDNVIAWQPLPQPYKERD